MDDLQLTKKAEAYVAQAISAQDADLLTLQIDRTSRKSLAGSITALIDMLDDLDPDPDLEDDEIEDTDEREPDNDTEANGDERDASATQSWAKGGHWCEDVEEQNEDGGDILDEPHDDDGIFSGCDNEPWLGWGNTMGQPGVDTKGLEDVQDSPDYGCEGFTGEGADMARQMLRTGRSRRPEPSLTIVGPVVTVPGWNGPLSQADVDRADSRTRYWAAKGF